MTFFFHRFDASVQNHQQYCFGKRFVKVLTPYWCTTQCVRTQRSHAAELLLNYIRLVLTHVYHSMKQSIIMHENFDKPFAIAKNIDHESITDLELFFKTSIYYHLMVQYGAKILF